VGGDFSQFSIVDVAARLCDTGDRRAVDATLQAWIEAPPVPGSFVCNRGAMLDPMTGGPYRSTPNRVRNAASRDRLSYPFFFDPNWRAQVGPIPGCATTRDEKRERRDGAIVHARHGTDGDDLLARVSKVSPELKRTVL